MSSCWSLSLDRVCQTFASSNPSDVHIADNECTADIADHRVHDPNPDRVLRRQAHVHVGVVPMKEEQSYLSARK